MFVMEEEEDIKMLLVKYITGQATIDEIILIKRWLNAHPENEQYFAQLYDAWQSTLVLTPNIVDTDKAYQLFVDKTTLKKSLPKAGKKPIAVAVALMVIILFTFLFKRSSETASNIRLKQLTAEQGSIRKVVLKDGTIVWLNSGTTLKYGVDFGKTTRTVFLEGEAFFEIAPGKKDVPFIVNAKNYIIRDIGTRFNLKAYPNDLFFETSVVSGEVSIENKEHKDNTDLNRIYIKQKQALRIWNAPPPQTGNLNAPPIKKYNEIQITQFTPDKELNYTGWKDNLLVFDGNTLQELSRVLERKYDVKININSADLRDIKYSGSFKNVKSIDRVLAIIKENTPIAYSISDNVITISRDKLK